MYVVYVGWESLDVHDARPMTTNSSADEPSSFRIIEDLENMAMSLSDTHVLGGKFGCQCSIHQNLMEMTAFKESEVTR